MFVLLRMLQFLATEPCINLENVQFWSFLHHTSENKTGARRSYSTSREHRQTEESSRAFTFLSNCALALACSFVCLMPPLYADTQRILCVDQHGDHATHLLPAWPLPQGAYSIRTAQWPGMMQRACCEIYNQDRSINMHLRILRRIDLR